MATFGLTSESGTSASGNNLGANYANDDALYTHTAGAGETLDSVSAYCAATTGTEASTVGVYTVVAGVPTTLVASGAITATTTPAWQTASGLSTALVEGTEYCAAVYNASTNNFRFYFKSGATQSYDTNEGMAATWTEDGTWAFDFALYATYSVASGATITGQPASVQPAGTGYTITGSGFGTTFATATLVMNGSSSVSATITGVTDTTVTFDMPAVPASQFDATGFTFTFVADDASTDDSAVVPYLPATGLQAIDVVNPDTTGTSFLNGYTGAAPVTGGQYIIQLKATGEGTPLDITGNADGTWSLSGALTVDNTTTVYYINAAGEVGTEGTYTFLLGGGGGYSGGSNTSDALLSKVTTGLSITGNINDLEPAWIKDIGASIESNNTIQAWHEYWDEEGISAGSFNDRAMKWLGSLGYSGCINDRWAAYWRS